MMMMKRIRQFSLMAIAAVFLVACGQKGPLFLPDNQPEKETGKATERVTQKPQEKTDENQEDVEQMDALEKGAMEMDSREADS